LRSPECLLSIAQVLSRRARTTRDHEDLVRAVAYFARAEQLDEDLGPEILAEYGWTLAAMGKLEQAKDVLTRAVDGQTDSPVAKILAQVEQRLDRAHELEQELAEIKNPASAKALRLRAESWALRGDTVQAAYLLDQVLTLEPTDQASWLRLGALRARMDAAERFVQEWPQPPGGPASWEKLALVCGSQGQWDAALTYLESGAGEAHPSGPRIWLALCDQAIRANENERARQYLAEAEQRGAAPDDVAAREKRIDARAAARE